MAVTPDQIKQLRELTGAGVMDCKRALEESGGDINKAVKVIEAQGLERAGKRAGREASQGVIESYIHQSRIGALVELNCETDFVARTEDFRTLAREIAMQVASMGPKYLSKDDVPTGTDEDPKQVALLEQPYIRDASRTIGQLVIETSAKTGEKVAVRRFSRFELGRE
ncbi:MAG: translation elongation factor Ts [Dehalococcoidia bacterium]